MTVRNVDSVIVPALEPMGTHGADCPLCRGRGRVGLSRVRERGGEHAAEWLSRPERCPLWSGTDGLRELVPARVSTGGAA